jgi:hypothetical protein
VVIYASTAMLRSALSEKRVGATASTASA